MYVISIVDVRKALNTVGHNRSQLAMRSIAQSLFESYLLRKLKGVVSPKDKFKTLDSLFIIF